MLVSSGLRDTASVALVLPSSCIMLTTWRGTISRGNPDAAPTVKVFWVSLSRERSAYHEATTEIVEHFQAGMA